FYQAKCSLRIRFVPTNGPPIFSQVSTVVLNGPPPKSADAAKPALLSGQGSHPKLPPGSALPWPDLTHDKESLASTYAAFKAGAARAAAATADKHPLGDDSTSADEPSGRINLANVEGGLSDEQESTLPVTDAGEPEKAVHPARTNPLRSHPLAE